MVKFDSDYAIFGTLAAEIIEGIPLGESVVSYTNSACSRFYGKLQGKTIAAIFADICREELEAEKLLNILEREGIVTFEGTLSDRFF